MRTGIKPTKCFVPLQKLRTTLAPSTCYYWPFQGGSCSSLLPVFDVTVSVTFHLMCVHIILVWFGLPSDHL